MLTMEEVLSEWNGEELNEQGLPPGFRFHPTDEELVTFYLASKVFNGSFSGAGGAAGVHIVEVDLNRCEPWDLPETAKMGEREWYFFSLRDRKYPTGLRTNRATGAGYWKATGKDREVYGAYNGVLLGMKKTLVFYKGRAPRGIKTRWVMHEYRLDGHLSYRHSCKEEWVICRIFHKRGEKKGSVFQGQNFIREVASAGPNSQLPPLHETPTPPLDTHLQNSFLVPHQQESDLRTLLNPFTLSALQASFPQTTTAHTASINASLDTNYHQLPSMTFKSILSRQHIYSTNQKEQDQQQPGTTAIKQFKQEPYFSNITQLLHDHNNSKQGTFNLQPHWLDKTLQIPTPHPLTMPPPPMALPSSHYPSNFRLDSGIFGFATDMSTSVAAPH